MTRRCPRCGDVMEAYYVVQRHCRRCAEEVRRLIEADTRRRAPRFAVTKDLTRSAA